MKKILLLVNDKWHPKEVSEKGIKNALIGYEIEAFHDAGQVDFDNLDKYDLIVSAKGRCDDESQSIPWITEEIEEKISEYIKMGKGMLFVHSGVTYFKRDSKYFNISKGMFLKHPEGLRTVTYSPVGKHPVLDGVKSFEISDEQYFCDVSVGESKSILVAGQKGEPSTNAGWVSDYGKGRVCVVTPAHTDEGFANEMVKKLINNAAKWCMGLI